MKPWLLEVNYGPSLSANTPLDWAIKSQVIHDSFKIMNVTHENKMRLIRRERKEVKNRLIADNPIINNSSFLERKYFMKYKQRKFDSRKYKHLKKDKGNLFEKIYPIPKALQLKRYKENFERYIDFSL